MWILIVPVLVVLFCSTVFLINIVRVLMMKLHPKSATPAPLAIKKAVRATLILVRLEIWPAMSCYLILTNFRFRSLAFSTFCCRSAPTRTRRSSSTINFSQPFLSASKAFASRFSSALRIMKSSAPSHRISITYVRGCSRRTIERAITLRQPQRHVTSLSKCFSRPLSMSTL